MINYHDKTDLLTKKILVHVAKSGFGDLSSFSRLAKAINIGRSLLYFYYKKEEDIVDGLFEIFIKEVDHHYQIIVQKQLNFDQYLDYLVDIRDLYFFTIECVKAVPNRLELKRFLEYGGKKIDLYSLNQFIKKYELEFLEQSQIDYMYAALRSRWFERSGPFESWSLEKVNFLRNEMDLFIIGLKDEMGCGKKS